MISNHKIGRLAIPPFDAWIDGWNLAEGVWE